VELAVLESLGEDELVAGTELDVLDVVKGAMVEVDDELDSNEELEELDRLDERVLEVTDVDELDATRLLRRLDEDTSDEMPETIGTESLV
tara:strand:+ start:232 stop:501 length:270 start_codon:yes stop_codon:yes gene_type:complete